MSVVYDILNVPGNDEMMKMPKVRLDKGKIRKPKKKLMLYSDKCRVIAPATKIPASPDRARKHQ